MYTNHNLATDIIDVFDNFLASKNIEIPCTDPEEEAVRHDDDNCACLYLSLLQISEPTRLLVISYAVYCLKRKN